MDGKLTLIRAPVGFGKTSLVVDWLRPYHTSITDTPVDVGWISEGDNDPLALDDYHVITAPAIHQAFTYLLDHLPPQCHLLIISCNDPPLPLARLRSQGQMVGLRADDLRFNRAETAVFLNNLMHLNLTPDDVAALETRTEGWITSLKLAALSLQRRPDASHPELFAANGRLKSPHCTIR